MVNCLLGGIPVEFDNRYPDLERLCRGYKTALPPELTMRGSDEELAGERQKQTGAFSDG